MDDGPLSNIRIHESILMGRKRGGKREEKREGGRKTGRESFSVQ